MPAVDVIVAALVAAFVARAGLLAWVGYQTRDLPPVRVAGKLK